MKTAQKLVFSIVAIALFVYISAPAIADWDESDGHKMHWPQLPDPDGWDIDMTNYVLADDWECSQTGPVSDIHFWYSNAFETGPITPPHFAAVNVSIHSDVPIGPNNPLGYSHPGGLEWSATLTGTVAGPWQSPQGWDDPQPDTDSRLDDHFWYWQYNITDIDQPFIQQAGTTYWLDLQVIDPEIQDVGWKTTFRTKDVLGGGWNDDAVYMTATGGWAPIAICDQNLEKGKWIKYG